MSYLDQRLHLFKRCPDLFQPKLDVLLIPREPTSIGHYRSRWPMWRGLKLL